MRKTYKTVTIEIKIKEEKEVDHVEAVAESLVQMNARQINEVMEKIRDDNQYGTLIRVASAVHGRMYTILKDSE